MHVYHHLSHFAEPKFLLVGVQFLCCKTLTAMQGAVTYDGLEGNDALQQRQPQQERDRHHEDYGVDGRPAPARPKTQVLLVF